MDFMWSVSALISTFFKKWNRNSDNFLSPLFSLKCSVATRRTFIPARRQVCTVIVVKEKSVQWFCVIHLIVNMGGFTFHVWVSHQPQLMHGFVLTVDIYPLISSCYSKIIITLHVNQGMFIDKIIITLSIKK